MRGVGHIVPCARARAVALEAFLGLAGAMGAGDRQCGGDRADVHSVTGVSLALGDHKECGAAFGGHRHTFRGAAGRAEGP